MATIPEEVSTLLERLPPGSPPGSPPDGLLRTTVAPEVGEAMEQALEDCERIDPDE